VSHGLRFGIVGVSSSHRPWKRAPGEPARQGGIDVAEPRAAARQWAGYALGHHEGEFRDDGSVTTTIRLCINGP
jgi:hypothetical protein